MRTLESLVKKAGGWNKIKDIGLQHNMISAVLAFLEEMSMDIFDKTVNSLKDAFGITDNNNKQVCDDISKKLHEEIDAAYEYACNNKKSYRLIWLLPRCVVESVVANSIFIWIVNYSIKEPEHIYNRLNRFFDSKNEKQLALDIDKALNTINGMFVFVFSPEQKFWKKFDSITFERKENAIRICKNLDFYKEYIQAHPECEKEIKEFCKQ